MTSSRKPRPTVAELIGETPAMLKLCGQIIQLEMVERPSMTDKAYRVRLRSLRHHMRVMQRMQREAVRGPMMDGWTDEEIDIHLARGAA